jgi:hypothetical protein
VFTFPPLDLPLVRSMEASLMINVRKLRHFPARILSVERVAPRTCDTDLISGSTIMSYLHRVFENLKWVPPPRRKHNFGTVRRSLWLITSGAERPGAVVLGIRIVTEIHQIPGYTPSGTARRTPVKRLGCRRGREEDIGPR